MDTVATPGAGSVAKCGLRKKTKQAIATCLLGKTGFFAIFLNYACLGGYYCKMVPEHGAI